MVASIYHATDPFGRRWVHVLAIGLCNVLLALAVLAAVATPTPDPLTMLLAMGPLFLLFEGSILLSAWLNRVSPPGTWWGEDDDEDSLAPAFVEDED